MTPYANLSYFFVLLAMMCPLMIAGARGKADGRWIVAATIFIVLLQFITPLQGLENVFLTPHIGGATEEAQANIGEEVPTALIRFVNTGSTLRSVNFPEVDLAPSPGRHRILNVHKNVPGVLREINRIVSDLGANIQAQGLATDAEVGYLVLDTDKAVSSDVKGAIEALSTSIKTRILY
jgi:D-3-phosphoglycerate dehydrogenase